MATKKVTELTATTSTVGADLAMVVTNVSTVPASKKVTIANLLKQLFLADATQLTISTIVDGEFLKRSGTNITSGTPSSGGATLTYLMMPTTGTTGTATGIGTANQVRVMRIQVLGTISVNTAAIHVINTGGASTAKCGIGLYTTAGNLLVDSTPITTSANGYLSHAVASAPVSVAPGEYYFAWTLDSTTPTIASLSMSVNYQILLTKNATATMFTAANASVAGQLPATLGSLTALANSADQVFLGFFFN